VTIHQAQGLTVDASILLVDEATTAEGLYVGMTRGRRGNVALAVREEADGEHGPSGPSPSEAEVVLGAMARSTAEVAALETLRETLIRSESLATLRPRLANLDAWIAKETPADRSRELQWATESLDHARVHCRPGHLTRSGREDRRRLEAAEDRYHAVAGEQARRAAWLEAHADTLAYRDQLGASVRTRRRELGATAAATQPAHVVDLLGAVPLGDPEAMERWVARAARIESYREEWGVEPEALRERPADRCQAQAWEADVRMTEMLAPPAPPTRDLSRDLGIGLGW
jgi:hypothetical protein